MKHRQSIRRRCAIVLAVLVWSAITIASETFVPPSDDVVLETLPRALFSDRDGLAALRRQVDAAPDDAKLAAALSRRYLEIGGQGGDPRYFGFARAVLEPWWHMEDAPAELLLLRAKLNEKDHRYTDAIADLRRLLDQREGHAQALVELANLQRVQGRYAQAASTCDSLGTDHSFAARVCRIPLLAATGKATQAYRLLADMVRAARNGRAPGLQWMLVQQALVAQSIGMASRAEVHFREALLNRPADAYLLRAYADLLLDEQRYDEVVTLLMPHIADNGVLLRAAIAAQRNGDRELARQWRSLLENRFAELRLRGSEPHGRYESRFMLTLRDEPQRALTIARANWRKQKEARDSRNLLEAAIAANRPASAKDVRRFLERHDTEDVTLTKLARAIP